MTPTVGDPAPATVGIAVDGSRLDLATLRPSPVVLEFFRGTW